MPMEILLIVFVLIGDCKLFIPKYDVIKIYYRSYDKNILYYITLSY